MPEIISADQQRIQFNTGSCAGPVAVFSRKLDGNMSLHHGDTGASLENRRTFLEAYGIDYRQLVCARQVHASGVYRAQAQDRGRGAMEYATACPETDGFITGEKNVPLAIFTADCLPVFLYAPQYPCIGLVHAGWRSTAAGIVAKTLACMREAFGVTAQQVYAGFGPAIRQCCYEVGAQFRDTFPGQVSERQGRLFFDLVAANTAQLLEAGVRREFISDCGICTGCRCGDYFSHRRQPLPGGRMLSVMMLR